MKGRPPRPQSHAGLPPLPPEGQALGPAGDAAAGLRLREGRGSPVPVTCGGPVWEEAHRPSPGVRGAAEAPPGAGRACAAEGRKEDRGPPAPLSASRPGAGKPGSAGGGSQARGGTGVSQPAAAGGREKLGQQQQRKDKMAAAQEEVRSEARAHGRGACAGKVQRLMEEQSRHLGAGQETEQKARSRHLRAGRSV